MFTNNRFSDFMNNHLARALDARPGDISDVVPMDKGLTNRSFILTCRGRRYVLRTPGDSSEKYISRTGEADAYSALRGRGICLDPVYLDPDSGYMLTPYMAGSRTCDAKNWADVDRCMEKLRALHELDLSVASRFDLYRQLMNYESFRPGPSLFPEYDEVRDRILRQKEFVDAHAAPPCLTHSDTVPENYLFAPGPEGERLYIIDWEYGCAQDPHADVAMFAASAMYDAKDFERLLSAYFPEGCSPETKIKIGCMTAVFALIWSTWYEATRGMIREDVGELAARQFRAARDMTLELDRAIGNTVFPGGASFLS